VIRHEHEHELGGEWEERIVSHLSHSEKRNRRRRRDVPCTLFLPPMEHGGRPGDRRSARVEWGDLADGFGGAENKPAAAVAARPSRAATRLPGCARPTTSTTPMGTRLCGEGGGEKEAAAKVAAKVAAVMVVARAAAERVAAARAAAERVAAARVVVRAEEKATVSPTIGVAHGRPTIRQRGTSSGTTTQRACRRGCRRTRRDQKTLQTSRCAQPMLHTG
jgi:hypothetical protein